MPSSNKFQVLRPAEEDGVDGLTAASPKLHRAPSPWPCGLVGRAKQVLAASYSQIRANCSSLNASPKELGVCFYLKFGDSYGYFAVSQILVLYLHSEFGISDVEAGAAYGMWGVSITFWGLACSVFNDYFGVRKAMLLGFILSSFSYVLLACATSKAFVYVVLFVILPLGNSLGIPMISIGIKRFTTTANRGFAFAVFYAIMNVAAFLSGPVIDALTIGLGPRGLVLSSSSHWSPNRCVILTASLSSLISFFVTLLFLRDVQVDENGVEITKDSQQDTVQTTFAERRAKLYLLVTSPTFVRFSTLTLLLVNLNAVFRHLDATFPTFVVRTFGADAPKGMLYSINPLMIVFLVPLVGAATTRFANFDMIKYGGYVTAVAPLALAASVSIPGCVGMVVLLSLGEAIWSPRTYDYCYSIAPHGQEASFSALATAPLFAAKIPVGLLSGWLLETYCPEFGPKNGHLLWLIVALVTLSSPILITLLEKYIREPATAVGGSRPCNANANANAAATGTGMETGIVVLAEVELPSVLAKGREDGEGDGDGDVYVGRERGETRLLDASSSHSLL